MPHWSHHRFRQALDGGLTAKKGANIAPGRLPRIFGMTNSI
ncbi:hypothetical protein BURMUCF1_1563 [Burkholderia multivorans ATCC BAA-247]|uniref:Uncharacterized protein n=1 Tax=Burkholderia multivorans CGD2 TaxID=513052 RepID=B9BM98_9BURK|nr:hypothetical protein BURMUCGD2_1967 [Burkholderia multivorans CGD2]EEE14304.1 hypothetical protein BURMUCGD2M_2053 [Burkholderia multivorans CGD2M]EJO58392.1 hypothetical protein BURMUCF1_1563 [Burkholderia multivorans ATCC BAA-247]